MQKNVKEEDLTVDLTAEKVLFSTLYLPIVSNIECECIIFECAAEGDHHD
jgi:hypothetical protein